MSIYVPIPAAHVTLMFDEPDEAAPTVAAALKAAVEEGHVLALNVAPRGMVVVNLAAVGPLWVLTVPRDIDNLVQIPLTALA